MDAGTKTCTLTGDVTSELSDGIIIGSDGITLQGDQTPGVGIPSIIGLHLVQLMELRLITSQTLQ